MTHSQETHKKKLAQAPFYRFVVYNFDARSRKFLYKEPPQQTVLVTSLQVPSTETSCIRFGAKELVRPKTCTRHHIRCASFFYKHSYMTFTKSAL